MSDTETLPAANDAAATATPSYKPGPEQATAACLLTGVSRRQAFALIAECGSAGAALERIRHGGAAGVKAGRLTAPATLLELCERDGLGLTTYFDRTYPPALRHIPDPPLVLYVRGDTRCLAKPCVAVVGARRCSRLGAETAREFASGMLAGGATVISGLALGIDAAAHRGALAALAQGNGANTVAVMGAGLRRIYPASNTRLAHALVEGGGCLLSEYLPTIPPAKHQFPERNRLISGLSQGVVIVEAGERSGSLITARFALEQGREVMAVPGTIASGLSRGCHRLLRDGAALVEGPADVFEVLGITMHAPGASAEEPQALPAALGSVLAAVEPVVTTMDELVSATGLAPADLTARLLELELAGFVHQVGEGYIRRPFSRSS